jgi:hypothetical protein
MAGTARNLLAAASLVLLAAGQLAYGQEAGRLGAPRPLADAEPATPAAGPEAPRPWPPADYRLPPLDVPSDRPFQGGDPELDLPGFPPPGWFTNVELGLIGAHFKNRLNGTVALQGGGTDTVAVPAADLSWTVAPRFELGYRIPDGAGEILLSYRFLITDGQANVLSDQGPMHLKSRLDTNVFDFDFANRDPLLTHWEMRWRAGARLAAVYFDSQSNLPGPAALLTGAAFQQRETSSYIGAGPHAGLELFRRLNLPGLALYGAVDGAAMYGHMHHTFAESFTASGPAPSGFGTYGKSQAVAVIGTQLGLRWVPSECGAVRFFLGYQFEQWYQVSRNDGTAPGGGSKGELTENGIFFRGEVTY